MVRCDILYLYVSVPVEDLLNSKGTETKKEKLGTRKAKTENMTSAFFHLSLIAGKRCLLNRSVIMSA